MTGAAMASAETAPAAATILFSGKVPLQSLPIAVLHPAHAFRHMMGRKRTNDQKDC
jgi:hypothetical protein